MKQQKLIQRFFGGVMLCALVLFGFPTMAKAVDASEFPLLIQKLSGPDGEANGAAMQLAKAGKAAIPELIKALELPVPSCRWAAWALGLTKDGEVIPSLIGALHHKDADTRRFVIQALGELPDPRSFQALLAVAGAPDYRNRSNAVFSLGQLGNPEALPFLRVALTDSDKKVRAEAARAVGKLHDRESLKALQNLAEKDPSTDVRNAASHAGKLLRP